MKRFSKRFSLLTLCLFLFTYLLCGAQAQTIIKKNNPQSRVVYFLMVDASSTTSAGKTGLTGAAAGTPITLTTGAAGSFTSVQFSTNGGTLTNCTGTISEIGKGYYAYVPTSAESNTTYDCLFVAQASGALDYAGQVAFSTYKVDDLGPQTDKIGNNAGDSPNTVTMQGRVDVAVSSRSSHSAADVWAVTTRSLTTLLGLVPASGFYANLPSVTLAAGQNIAANNLPTDYQQRGQAVTLPSTVLQANDLTAITNSILGMTVYGGLNFKQLNALNYAMQMDATRTWNASTHISTYTWYVRTGINTVDLTKPLVTKTSIYDSTNTQIVSQSTNILTANLP